MKLEHLDLDIPDKSYEFSNFRGKTETTSSSEGGGGGVDSTAIAGAIGSVAGAIGAFAGSQSDMKQEVKARCGSRPWFGKDKKAAYRECAEEVYEEQKAYGNQSNQPQQGQYGAPQGGQYGGMPRGGYGQRPPKNKKGMSTGAIVGISIAGIAVLGTVVYFATKRK